MKSLSLRGASAALLHLFVALTPTVALAQDAIETQTKEAFRQDTDTAIERGTQASPDPWTVGTSSALFSRPTLGEAAKFSAEATKEGVSYSLALAPAGLSNSPSPYLAGFQVLVAHTPESRVASLGLKWNLSLQDIRTLPRARRDAVFRAGEADFQQCVSAAEGLPEAEHEAALIKCGEAQGKAISLAKEEQTFLRPNISAGVSAAYDFNNGQWRRVASNVALELKPADDFSIVVNGDFESERREDGLRHPNVGGSLAASYVPPIFEERSRIEFAGKVLACLENCGEESSTVLFGPTLSYAFTKDSLVGLTLNWSGKGQTAGDAFLGLSLTHSIGPQ